MDIAKFFVCSVKLPVFWLSHGFEMKKKAWLWALSPVLAALALHGCGGSDSGLIVDNNAQSCSVVSSSGSPVVVGSGLTGDPAAPEAASGYTEKPGWTTSKFAVAAANPLATDAGYQILKAGGSAVDAAIAVQMVLTLVEPQSSGIGGGAFLLHFNGKDVEAFDGRETAPMAATEKLFLKADGKPMAFYEGVVGGRSVGTPGTVRMLEMAHKQHGKLPWSTLFQPAISLAEGGFKVSARLNTLLKGNKTWI